MATTALISDKNSVLLVCKTDFCDPQNLSNNVGSAFIFKKNENNVWQFKKSFIVENGNFGSSSAINEDGTIFVVGQPFDEFGGSISIYTGDGIENWGLKNKIFGNTDDVSFFGVTVDINSNGDTIVVGNKEYDYNGFENNGAVSLYSGNSIDGWNFKQRIIPLCGSGHNPPGLFCSDDANYGCSIAINQSGNILAVGSNLNRIALYTGNLDSNWFWYQNIVGPTGSVLFGAAGIDFDANGQVLAIGAPGYDYEDLENQNYNGLTYIYTGNSNSTWRLKNRFVGFRQDNKKNPIGSNWGKSLKVNYSGDTIIIGGPLSSLNNQYAGAAALYKGNNVLGWELFQKITKKNSNNFGQSVSCNDNSESIVITDQTGINFYNFSGDLIFEPSSSSSTSTELFDTFFCSLFDEKVGGSQSFFGTSVKNVGPIGTNSIVVGAPQYNYEISGDSTPGAALLYIGPSNLFKWTLDRTIPGKNLFSGSDILGSRFGSNVTMNEDRSTIISVGPENSGKVEIYTNIFGAGASNWTLRLTITGSNSESKFEGVAVNADASIIAIGETNGLIIDNETYGVVHIYTGAAYNGMDGINVLQLGGPKQPTFLGWGLSARLSGVNTSSSNLFGKSIDINLTTQEVQPGLSAGLIMDTIITVGAPQELYNSGNTSSYENGALYIYKSINRQGTSWILAQKILGYKDSQFGFSNSINAQGSRIAVGAPSYTKLPLEWNGLTNVGRVDIYTGNPLENNWILDASFEGSTQNMGLGFSVALDFFGKTCIAGAPTANTCQVYRRFNKWVRVCDIEHPFESDFGYSVSTSKANEVFSFTVGAPSFNSPIDDSENDVNNGSVSIYTLRTTDQCAASVPARVNKKSLCFQQTVGTDNSCCTESWTEACQLIYDSCEISNPDSNLVSQIRIGIEHSENSKYTFMCDNDLCWHRFAFPIRYYGSNLTTVGATRNTKDTDILASLYMKPFESDDEFLSDGFTIENNNTEVLNSVFIPWSPGRLNYTDIINNSLSNTNEPSSSQEEWLSTLQGGKFLDNFGGLTLIVDSPYYNRSDCTCGSSFGSNSLSSRFIIDNFWIKSLNAIQSHLGPVVWVNKESNQAFTQPITTKANVQIPLNSETITFNPELCPVQNCSPAGSNPCQCREILYDPKGPYISVKADNLQSYINNNSTIGNDFLSISYQDLFEFDINPNTISYADKFIFSDHPLYKSNETSIICEPPTLLDKPTALSLSSRCPQNVCTGILYQGSVKINNTPINGSITITVTEDFTTRKFTTNITSGSWSLVRCVRPQTLYNTNFYVDQIKKFNNYSRLWMPSYSVIDWNLEDFQESTQLSTLDIFKRVSSTWIPESSFVTGSIPGYINKNASGIPLTGFDFCNFCIFPVVSPPIITGDCYNTIIRNEPECCEAWPELCQTLYDECKFSENNPSKLQIVTNCPYDNFIGTPGGFSALTSFTSALSADGKIFAFTNCNGIDIYTGNNNIWKKKETLSRPIGPDYGFPPANTTIFKNNIQNISITNNGDIIVINYIAITDQPPVYTAIWEAHNRPISSTLSCVSKRGYQGLIDIYTGSINSTWVLQQTLSGQKYSPPYPHLGFEQARWLDVNYYLPKINKNGTVLATLFDGYVFKSGKAGTIPPYKRVTPLRKDPFYGEQWKSGYYNAKFNYCGQALEQQVLPALDLDGDSDFIVGGGLMIFTGNKNSKWVLKQIVTGVFSEDLPGVTRHAVPDSSLFIPGNGLKKENGIFVKGRGYARYCVNEGYYDNGVLPCTKVQLKPVTDKRYLPFETFEISANGSIIVANSTSLLTSRSSNYLNQLPLTRFLFGERWGNRWYGDETFPNKQLDWSLLNPKSSLAAPSYNFGQLGGFIYVGNPTNGWSLKQTLIDSLPTGGLTTDNRSLLATKYDISGFDSFKTDFVFKTPQTLLQDTYFPNLYNWFEWNSFDNYRNFFRVRKRQGQRLFASDFTQTNISYEETLAKSQMDRHQVRAISNDGTVIAIYRPRPIGVRGGLINLYTGNSIDGWNLKQELSLPFINTQQRYSLLDGVTNSAYQSYFVNFLFFNDIRIKNDNSLLSVSSTLFASGIPNYKNSVGGTIYFTGSPLFGWTPYSYVPVKPTGIYPSFQGDLSSNQTSIVFNSHHLSDDFSTLIVKGNAAASYGPQVSSRSKEIYSFYDSPPEPKLDASGRLLNPFWYIAPFDFSAIGATQDSFQRLAKYRPRSTGLYTRIEAQFVDLGGVNSPTINKTVTETDCIYNFSFPVLFTANMDLTGVKIMRVKNLLEVYNRFKLNRSPRNVKKWNDSRRIYRRGKGVGKQYNPYADLQSEFEDNFFSDFTRYSINEFLDPWFDIFDYEPNEYNLISTNTNHFGFTTGDGLTFLPRLEFGEMTGENWNQPDKYWLPKMPIEINVPKNSYNLQINDPLPRIVFQIAQKRRSNVNVPTRLKNSLLFRRSEPLTPIFPYEYYDSITETTIRDTVSFRISRDFIPKRFCADPKWWYCEECPGI